jgi:hypothetical protein
MTPAGGLDSTNGSFSENTWKKNLLTEPFGEVLCIVIETLWYHSWPFRNYSMNQVSAPVPSKDVHSKT